MLLRRHEAETGRLVDAARGVQRFLRPEHDLAVPARPRECHAFGHELLAESEAARSRLDDEQPELRDRLRFGDQENAADVLAVALGDPAALARRIEMLDEFA